MLWKQTGINPLTFNKVDDAHGYNGKMFKIISVVELIIVGLHALKADWYSYLLPFWYLEHPIALQIGWGLLILSFVWIWIAQNHMSKSWRIGIDEVNKTELVTHGLFTISRNPVFLGIMIANIGLFFIIPNAFTLLIICLSNLTINTQIRLEEDFLKKEFGIQYTDYLTKVRRWI